MNVRFLAVILGRAPRSDGFAGNCAATCRRIRRAIWKFSLSVSPGGAVAALFLQLIYWFVVAVFFLREVASQLQPVNSRRRCKLDGLCRLCRRFRPEPADDIGATEVRLVGRPWRRTIPARTWL